jgi:glycogen synthase
MAECEDCFVIAPYFAAITDLDDLVSKGRIKAFSILSTFDVPVGDRTYPVEMVEIIGLDGLKTYLLGSEDFFSASQNPYVNLTGATDTADASTRLVDEDKLVVDALFFCAAVPVVLAELGRLNDLVLHLQDWETACVAQAVRRDPRLEGVACLLTLHNPYDKYLGSVTSSTALALMAHLGLEQDNVLAQMIPLVDGPVSTVSQNFARELTCEPLFTNVYADHLQGVLQAKEVVGVDNGIFGELAFPFSPEAQQKAEQGDFGLIQQEKWARRLELSRVLEESQRQMDQHRYVDQESWGSDIDLSDPWTPVFFIMGRDDPCQKGYDVIADAIRSIPKGKARYVFTPMPGAEGVAGLEFLSKLASDLPGEVKVFPFRIGFEMFQALRRGSSFMVMGSLYEPFGAATEAYLDGTPVVARATGGLVQQVVPYSDAYLSAYGRQLVASFHNQESAPTGFLYRESLSGDLTHDWRQIVDRSYWTQHPKADRVESRRAIPLFEASAQSAASAIQDAIDLYISNQIEYACMIYGGYKLLDRFSWDRTVRGYRHLYDLVNR